MSCMPARNGGVRATVAKVGTMFRPCSDVSVVALVSGKVSDTLELAKPGDSFSVLRCIKNFVNKYFKKIDQAVDSLNAKGPLTIKPTLQNVVLMSDSRLAKPLEPQGVSSLHMAFMPSANGAKNSNMATLIETAIQDTGRGGHNLDKLHSRAPELYALLMSEVITNRAVLLSGSADLASVTLTERAVKYDFENRKGASLQSLLRPENVSRFEEISRAMGDDLLAMGGAESGVSGDLMLAFQLQPRIDNTLQQLKNNAEPLAALKKNEPRGYRAMMREVLTRGLALPDDVAGDSPAAILMRAAVQEDRENGSPILIEMGKKQETKTRFADMVAGYISDPAEAMALFRASNKDTVSEMATRYALNRATTETNHQTQEIRIDFTALSKIIDGLVLSGFDIDNANETLMQAARVASDCLDSEMHRIPDSVRRGDMSDYFFVVKEMFKENVSPETQRLMDILDTFKKAATSAGAERELLAALIDGVDSQYMPEFESAAKSMGVNIPWTHGEDGGRVPDKAAAELRRDVLKSSELNTLEISAALKLLTIDSLAMIDSVPEGFSGEARLGHYFKKQLGEVPNADRVGRCMATACLTALSEVSL